MSLLSILAGLATFYMWLTGFFKKLAGRREQRQKDLEDSQKGAEKGKKIDEEVDKMTPEELDEELDHYRGA